MELPRFQFGLRFFIFAVFVAAFALVFIWEKANEPPLIHSNSNILGAATYGDVAALDELTLSPAQALRSVKRDWRQNTKLQKQVPSDVIWQSVDIDPLESELEDAREFPLIGYAAIRKRDFRCALEGIDSNGNKVNAIVIVNRNHFHIPEQQ